jgi:hypothetical protein
MNSQKISQTGLPVALLLIAGLVAPAGYTHG